MWATVSLGLLAAYHVLRLIAAQCTGAGCDWLIPLSLLLPLSVLATVAVTGLMGIGAARSRGQTAWLGVFGAGTVLGVLGPIVSLALIRDRPDADVLVATVLSAVVPVMALIYGFLRGAPRSSKG